jgi:hypothetical protein
MFVNVEINLFVTILDISILHKLNRIRHRHVLYYLRLRGFGIAYLIYYNH